MLDASDHLQPVAAAAPGEDAVSIDAACRRCGYNLRGLLLSGQCPECGWPVAQSLVADLYRFAPPEHVARLHRGALIAEVTVLLWIPVWVTQGIFQMIVGFAWLGLDPATSRFLSVCLGSALSLAHLYGWWLLSAPDPGRGAADGPRSQRVLRVAIVVGVARAAFDPLLATMGGSLMGLAPGVSGVPGAVSAGAMLATALGWLSALVLLAQFFASVFYVRRMAPRFPDHIIATRARTLLSLVGWTTFGAVGLGLLTALVGLFAGQLAMAMLIPTCLGSLVVLVIAVVGLVLYAMLLDRLRSMLWHSVHHRRWNAGIT